MLKAVVLILGLFSPVSHAIAESPISIPPGNDPGDRRLREAEPPPAPRRLRDDEPTRVFTDEQGRTCRTYARQVVIAGEPRSAVATVCREPNGRWVLSR